MSFAYIFVNYASILFQHQYTLLPNMSKKSAALEAKFEIAVKTLLKAPNLTVQEAMLVAKFSTKDIENKSMQKILARRIPGGKRAMAALLPPASGRSTQQSNSEGGEGRGGRRLWRRSRRRTEDGGRQRGRDPERGDGGTEGAQSP